MEESDFDDFELKRRKKREYEKKYREMNPEKVAARSKKYREDKKIKIKEGHKRYYEKNKEKILEKHKLRDRKKYYEINRDSIREYQREYQKEYCRKKYTNDIERIKHNITSLIRISIKKNNNGEKLKKILGCSIFEFKLYLESKFETWMNWENRGLYNGELNYGWDLDHIIPLNSATTEEDIIRLNHYTNFQPLCSYQNRYVKK